MLRIHGMVYHYARIIGHKQGDGEPQVLIEFAGRKAYWFLKSVVEVPHDKKATPHYGDDSPRYSERGPKGLS